MKLFNIKACQKHPPRVVEKRQWQSQIGDGRCCDMRGEYGGG